MKFIFAKNRRMNRWKRRQKITERVPHFATGTIKNAVQGVTFAS